MYHAKHLVRAFLILVVLGIAGFFLRYLEIPPSFGDKGHYRADNIYEQRNLEPQHGPVGSCKACHEEAEKVKAAGVHKTVACESCHAPLARHVREGKKIAEMPRSKVAELCINCHQKLEGRPVQHKQIDVRAHLSDAGQELTKEVCYECHNHHDPKKDLK